MHITELISSSEEQSARTSPRTYFFPNSEGVQNVYGVNFENCSFDVIFLPRNVIPHLYKRNDPQFIFMQKPLWANEKEWTKFTSNLDAKIKLIKDQQIRPNLNKLYSAFFFVESTPISLVRFACFLDPQNNSLKELNQLFAQQFKPPIYDEFIDLVIAGNFFDSDGHLKEAPDFEGERLMLGLLLGDKQSADELIKRGKTYNSQIPFTPKETYPPVTNNGLTINDLVAIHATDYLPYSDSSGVFLRSRYDGSGEKETRLSVHFALNHHVVSHKGGDWDKSPYVLVSPLADLIKANGQPYSLRPEDTYFITSPGRPFILPSTTKLVRPRDNSDDTPIPLDTVYYGTKVLLSEELSKVAAHWTNVFYSSHDLIEPCFNDEVDSWRFYTVPGRFPSFEEFIQARLRGTHKELSGSGLSSFFFGGQLLRTALKEACVNLAKKGAESIRRVTGQRNNSLDGLIQSLIPKDVSISLIMQDYQTIRDDIHKLIWPINKIITVEQVISDLGCRVLHIDPYYLLNEDNGYNDYQIQDSETLSFVKEVLELAENAAFSSIRNPKTAESALDNLLHETSRIISGEFNGIHSFYQTRKILMDLQSLVRERFTDTIPQYRRMAYLTGSYQLGDFFA